MTIYVSAQIDAIGTAFEGFLGWNYYVGAIVGFAVVLVYIVSGGFVAVVWSDVFQGSLMVIGLVALPFFGLAAAGGLEPTINGLQATRPAATVPVGSRWPQLDIAVHDTQLLGDRTGLHGFAADFREVSLAAIGRRNSPRRDCRDHLDAVSDHRRGAGRHGGASDVDERRRNP